MLLFVYHTSQHEDRPIYDHNPRSGVVYNFGRVCQSQTKTFESLDIGSSYLHIPSISREYGSSSYMKVMVTEAKKSIILIPAM